MTNDRSRDSLDGRTPAKPPSELHPSEPLPPTSAELQQGLALEGIIVESWQMDFLDQVLSGALRRPFNSYAIGRSKSHHRTQPFTWAATKYPSPPGVSVDSSTRLQLDMWPPDHRQQALAAKAARGKGPPSSASWRGRERNTKFRSQS